MGTRNVRAALAVGSKVSPSARLVLVCMALVSLDRDSDNGKIAARTYYGGHAQIIGMLGEFPSDTVSRRVRWNIAELVRAGLVEPDTRSGGPRHRHAVYRLHLGIGPVDEGVDRGPP